MNTIKQLYHMLAHLEFPVLVSISDIVEIVILAVIVYHILVWVQNTRTWGLIKGVVILLGIYALGLLLRLNTITYLMQRAAGVAVTAVLIIFQPELRRALEQLGSKNSVFRLIAGDGLKEEGFDSRCVEELIKASFQLGSACTGALIVIQREISLEEYEKTGIALDADISSPLLINIFEHNTPLHDGAVIIVGDKLASATCYLPLSKNKDISKDLGTRHRAAIGVSEVTDSLTVVVSEETGRVSVAENGQITQCKTKEELREKLSTLLVEPKENRIGSWSSLLMRKGWQNREGEDNK